MGRFSGKCDFDDMISIWGKDYILKSDVYVERDGPIKFETEDDFIPYYTHIVSSSAGGKESATIHLTRQSFIDIEESEWIKSLWNNVIRLRNKCKRNKLPFTVDYLIEHNVYSSNDDKMILREMYERILKDGENADISDLHFRFKTYLRQQLIDYAKEHGKENHPIIRNFGYKVLEYKKMEEKYKNLK